MNQFTITPMDAGGVALVIFFTQILKKHVMPRWVPIIPFVLGLIFAVPIILVTKGANLNLWVMISNIFLEGLKMAVLAMASFKWGYTTALNRDSKQSGK